MSSSKLIIVSVLSTVVVFAIGVIIGAYGIRCCESRPDIYTSSWGMSDFYYYDMQVLESEVRGEAVYVEVENVGTKTVTGMSFLIEVRDEDGRLINEYESTKNRPVQPGQTREFILDVYDTNYYFYYYEGSPPVVSLDGDVSVEFLYGYTY